MQEKQKLLIIANSARELELFKGDFIDASIAAGFSIAIICRGDDYYLKALKARGAEVFISDALRNSLSLVADIKYCWQLYKIIRWLKPDIVFNYTIKPVIYASIVARMTGVKNIFSLLPGLGYLFSHQTWKFRLSQTLCVFLYKIASLCNKQVIFLNQDDKLVFLQKKILPPNKIKVIDSEGVNLDVFNAALLPDGNKIIFLFVARMMREKGIIEFIRAAELLGENFPHAEFKIAGDCDEKTDDDLKDLIQHYKVGSSIHYMGYVKDIRTEIAKAHVFVLPSYYREGVPRSSMESMAMGRPIITSDWVGCKETVVDGKNGYLVPIKNVEYLALAMKKFIENPELIPIMGKASRQIAEQRFDIVKINDNLLNIIREKPYENYAH